MSTFAERTALVLVLATLCSAGSCAGAGAARRPGAGPAGAKRAPGACAGAVVQTDEEAARLARCRVITGTLRIGPSFSLTRLAPLGRIERVTGRLEVSGNLGLSGIYLPALRAVDGSLVLDDNRLVDTIALGRLARVSGDLVVRDNRALTYLDLGALRAVGGLLEVSGQRRLDQVRIEQLAHAGQLVIEGEPAWPPAQIDALRRRLHR